MYRPRLGLRWLNDQVADDLDTHSRHLLRTRTCRRHQVIAVGEDVERRHGASRSARYSALSPRPQPTVRPEPLLNSYTKSAGAGVFERRIHFGTGYRVYLGKDGDALIILLGGGTKQRQQDIDTPANSGENTGGASDGGFGKPWH